MGWARRGNTGSNSSSAATSLAASFGSNVTAGDTLILVFTNWISGGASSTGVSDNNGNTWVKAVEGFPGASENLGIYYVLNANAGATTVTVTWAANQFCQMFVQAYSGGNSPWFASGMASIAGPSTSPYGSGSTPFNASGGELVIGAFGDPNSHIATLAINDGKTSQYAQHLGGVDMIVDDLLSASAGTQSASFTDTTNYATAVAVAYFELGTGPSVDIPQSIQGWY